MKMSRIKIISLLAAALVLLGVCWIINSDKGAAPSAVPSSGEISYSGPDFSISYPKGYAADESYKYQELGPGKDISGVKFTIPAKLAAGTNLGTDSYISVEEIPHASVCSASLFINPETVIKKAVSAGVIYSLESMGAAAGNRYDETVYAVPGSDPCIAVRYFIHYGVFENYPPGSIRQFDEPALISQFDRIRHSLMVSQ
jgi:hypothetical protein